MPRQVSDRPDLILAFMRSYMIANGPPPAIRDICKGVGIASTSVVDFHLNVLKRRGLVTRANGATRGAVPIDMAVFQYGEPVTVRTDDGELVTGRLVAA